MGGSTRGASRPQSSRLSRYKTFCASVDSSRNQEQGNAGYPAGSFSPSVAVGDQIYTAFSSDVRMLVASDTNKKMDVFLHLRPKNWQ